MQLVTSGTKVEYIVTGRLVLLCELTFAVMHAFEHDSTTALKTYFTNYSLAWAHRKLLD